MEELKELKLGKDLVGNKDAQTLAHDLLGKIIHCADGDYLITVTEAYPADDYYSSPLSLFECIGSVLRRSNRANPSYNGNRSYNRLLYRNGTRYLFSKIKKYAK